MGAASFGYWGDRLGRKPSLIMLIGLASTGIGLLPIYAAADVAAAILLVVLRLLQRVALGAGGRGSVALGRFPGTLAFRWVLAHAPCPSKRANSRWPVPHQPGGLFAAHQMPDLAFDLGSGLRGSWRPRPGWLGGLRARARAASCGPMVRPAPAVVHCSRSRQTAQACPKEAPPPPPRARQYSGTAGRRSSPPCDRCGYIVRGCSRRTARHERGVLTDDPTSRLSAARSCCRGGGSGALTASITTTARTRSNRHGPRETGRWVGLQLPACSGRCGAQSHFAT